MLTDIPFLFLSFHGISILYHTLLLISSYFFKIPKHSDTYKEYQERSAFTQSHFRKKNAAAIDAYEEADKYIIEHIKAYYIKGKPPKQSDLQVKSTKLKEKYNALLPEHNAFLRRQAAASQYTRQVRQYLEAQRQQERNRQYNERKRTQQRNKDMLE